MNTAPAPPAAAPPASVVNNIVTKKLLPEQIQRILSGAAERYAKTPMPIIIYSILPRKTA
jgi:hypothetical protein